MFNLFGPTEEELVLMEKARGMTLGLSLDWITPVQRVGNLYIKRDDFFRPFSDMPINGGKVRQAITLIKEEYPNIIQKHNSTIATASSVHSPQSFIVARVAKHFGFKSVLGIGNVKNIEEVCKHHPSLKTCQELGMEIKILSKLAYNNTLYSLLAKQGSYYIVRFGMSAFTNAVAVMETTIQQVQNIPDELDDLVIPTGSGITAAGIINGIIRYKKKVRNIWCVQIAGFDRTKTINSLLTKNVSYTNVEYKKFPYSKYVKIDINGIPLDPIYEAKAWNWALENLDIKTGKILFWIVGDSNLVTKVI